MSQALFRHLEQTDLRAVTVDYLSLPDQNVATIWLTALERLLVSKSLINLPQVNEPARSWQRAVHTSPHGTPIYLENDLMRPGFSS